MAERSDVVGTGILAGVGAVAVAMGIGYGVFDDDGRIGAGFLPVATGGFILVASVAEIARMYLAAPPVPSASLLDTAQQVEEKATAAAAQAPEAEQRDLFGRTARQRNWAIIKIFATMLAALLLIPVLGLLLALGAMVLAIMLWIERKPVVPAVATTVATVAAAYLIFVVLLGVPVPPGMLGLI